VRVQVQGQGRGRGWVGGAGAGEGPAFTCSGVRVSLRHPNLVGLGELVCEDGLWFFTMDLIEGEDLLSWVRPAAPSAPARDEATPSTDTVRLDAAGDPSPKRGAPE
jgi:hypothetical protein